MATKRYLKFSIPNHWRHNPEVRRSVATLLEGLPSDFVHSATMAASELTENAIKYGTSTSETAEILVAIQIQEGRLSIRVTNGCDNPEALQRLSAHVDAVNRTDPYDMMVARIHDLKTRQRKTVGLGIYRIAAEGGFNLRLESEGNNTVTVVAERSLSNDT